MKIRGGGVGGGARRRSTSQKKKKKKQKYVSHHTHAPPFHLEKFLSVFGNWHHHFETLLPLNKLAGGLRIWAPLSATHLFGKDLLLCIVLWGCLLGWHLVPWNVAPRYNKN